MSGSRLPSRSHRLRALALLAVLAAIGGVTSHARAQSPDELREQRRQVQADAAALEEDVDALTDDIDALTAALGALSESVDAQQAALDAANRRVEAAIEAERAAQEAILRLEAELEATQLLLRDTAVYAYVSFQGPNSEHLALDGNPWEQARTETLVEFGTGNTAELIDDLQALGAELEAQRDAAAAYTAEADALRDDVAAKARALEDALAIEEAALAEVEDRLDARLAEVAALEALDAQLAAEIRAEEQRIADAIAARRRSTGPVTIPDNAPVDLTTVRGIVVNVVAAEPLEGFLAAMQAEGYTLGGGGYRSSDAQIRLRRAHCGTSDYAIWEMPASQCRPPTARPGRSAHEQGLAVDFTHNGSIIRSRSSAVFQTMQRVAPAFGWINLPSEPWHWSLTGT